jgi:RimK family alpha-L-glutamate ligase
MGKNRVAILGSPDSWHSRELTHALQGRGIEPEFIDPLSLQARLGEKMGVTGQGTDLLDFDLLLVREVPGGSLEQVIFRMDALHQLENMGWRVINSPYAIEKMVDKYYTSSLLQQAGIPVPDTRVCEDFSRAMEGFRQLSGDVVVKPLFGSRGAGMVRVTDPEMASRKFRALQMGGYIFYLQKFIPHNNRDIRVLVVGNDCLAAMERVGDDWKTNISVGARPMKLDVSAEIKDLCIRASKSVGADYCGVDLLRNEMGELYVIEVNSMPAWQGLQQVTEFNIADRIGNYCCDSITHRTEEAIKR